MTLSQFRCLGVALGFARAQDRAHTLACRLCGVCLKSLWSVLDVLLLLGPCSCTVDAACGFCGVAATKGRLVQQHNLATRLQHCVCCAVACQPSSDNDDPVRTHSRLSAQSLSRSVRVCKRGLGKWRFDLFFFWIFFILFACSTWKKQCTFPLPHQTSNHVSSQMWEREREKLCVCVCVCVCVCGACCVLC